MVQDDDDDDDNDQRTGLCFASTYCSSTTTTTTMIITIMISTVGLQKKQEGKREQLRYLLRAPLAFVEDIPENKHYFGLEQPQSGLESPLHLPFPVRSETTSKRYLLFLFTLLQSPEHRRMDRGRVMDCLKKTTTMSLPPQLVEPMSPDGSEEVGVR